MQREVDFHTIDVPNLTTVPMLTTAGYVSLIKNLIEVQPPSPSPSVERGLARLKEALAEAETALVARLGDEVDAGLERSFDAFVDRLWLRLRDLLDFWELYEHEGAALFTEEERIELEFDEGRELAAIAADLSERLFGEGSDFLRRSYPEQATFMASRLRLIEDKQPGDKFMQLVGERIVKLLEVSQRRYEAMVHARGSRTGGTVGDLRQLRTQLRRAIHLYSISVAGMLDERDPKTPMIVQRALLPNVIARPQRGGGGGGSEGATEDEGELSETTEAEQADAEQADDAVEDAETPGGG